MLRSRVLLALVILGAAACGRDLSKRTDGSSTTGPTRPPNSTTTPDPGQRTEQGSPDAIVVDAYNRLWPLMCAYDATCPEPLLDDACPAQSVPTGQLQGQCWVVDSTALAQCEGALRGLQCQGTYENFPLECANAMRQCECLDGFERAWPDDADQEGCYPVCATSDTCAAGEGCYDGVCLPTQEGRCADDQTFTAEGCRSLCVNGECAQGFVCDGELCVPE